MSGYFAGRDLFVGGRLAYPRGAPVPADAFPPAAVASLRANGGLRRQPEAFRTETPDVRTLSVDQAAELIAAVSSAAVLDRLHALERAHPRYAGGRKGVLDAIEERRGELAIEAR